MKGNIIKSERRMRLFDGSFANMNNVVGWCNSQSHRGYISKGLLKGHECLEKECTAFSKRNPEYWEDRTISETEKQRKIDEIKRKKKYLIDRDNYIREIFNEYKYIHLTSIQEVDNKTLRITYIYDGYEDLSGAIKKIQSKYPYSLWLKPIKTDKEIRDHLIRKGK